MRIRQNIILIILILLLAGCSQLFTPSLERRIASIEQGLLSEQGDPPWKRMDLAERMAYYKVPGVSIAVINDFQIEWAKGYGVLEAGKDQPVTTDTLFPPGSTAKPIVAMAALHYVEKGDLELDGDVNNKLVSWKIPENGPTAQAPVTLRRLLSHSAGIPYIPLHGYAQGLPFPNRQQILDGEPPANSEPVRVVIVPGTQHSYSNGGYIVVEQLLVDVVGVPFDLIMQELVLEPLYMEATTFKYPLPENLAPIAASGHWGDGSVIPGGWHTFPEMGTGASAWTTPSDMARFYIDLMSTYNGQSENIISQEMAIEMLTPQIEDRGLGPWVNDEGGDLFYFGHPGHNDGYKSYFVFYPKRGHGVVIMTNSENGDALYQEIVNSVSIEYGWLKNYDILYVGILLAIVLLFGGILILRSRQRARGKTA